MQRRIVLILIVLILASVVWGYLLSARATATFNTPPSARNPKAPQDACARTAHMPVYSDAYFSEEGGDVVGYELALEDRNSDADALLFVYEGTPNGDGIPLSGSLLNAKLALKGVWVEHLTEYPSKKKIVKRQAVKVDGRLNASRFQGQITIERSAPVQVRLRRVRRIWVCNTEAATGTTPPRSTDRDAR